MLVRAAILTLLFYPFVGHTEVVRIPAFSGKLYNYTSVASTNFEYSIAVRCFAAVGGESCGEQELVARVGADGAFQIPEISLDAGTVQESERRYSVYAVLKVSDSNPRFSFGVPPQDLITTVDGDDLSVLNTNAVKEFSAYWIEPGLLDLRLPDNEDLKAYLSGVGRDAGVDIDVDFSGSGEFNFNQTLRLEQTGFNRKNWQEVPARLALVRGNFGPNPPIAIQIKQETEYTDKNAIFRSDLVNVVGSIFLKKPEYIALPFERKIDGSYPGTQISLEYAQRDKVQFSDLGFSYATLKIKCAAGELTGTIFYRSGQDPAEPETSRDPVSGICFGEQGVIRLPLHLKSGGLIQVYAPFHRVRALKTPSGLDKLFQTEVITQEMDVFAASTISMWLPLFDGAGQYFGHLTVSSDPY